MPDAPDWFVRAYIDSMAHGEPSAAALWRSMGERGWESFRLTGGERLPSGRLSSPKKVPTLVIPTDGFDKAAPDG